MVEFALIFGIMMLIVAGTIDYGFAWRAGVAVTEAARAGTRVGSSMAVNPKTDYEVLSAVKASLASAELLDDVERVVIFRAASADGAAPATCTVTAPTTGDCVVVNGAQLNSIAPGNFSYVAGDPPTGSGCMTLNRMYATGSWCPRDRNNQLNTAHYIGVQITVRTDNLFPVLGETQVITRRSVMRLEPTPL